MKAKAIFCVLISGFFISNVIANEIIPMAISPGSDEGIAVVSQSCPTFSWTAVDWAQAYRVAVFEVLGTKALHYEEMQSLSLPVISKEIRGRALSWTPSSDERLVIGWEYVWYVQAIDAYGQGTWSEGRSFKVDVGLRFDGVDEKVKKKLVEQGLSEEVINEVLEDVMSGVRDVIAYGIDTMSSGDSTQNRMLLQDLEGEYDLNTFFGKDAGYTIMNSGGTGTLNTFIGRSSGFYNATGSSNTFLGYGAGSNNSSGNENTYLGDRAGYANTTGESNTFIGNWAGVSCTTNSDHSTFVGNKAGYNNLNSFNTFLGSYAGYSNTWGYFNTFVGEGAGYSNIDAISNTFVGEGAGYNITTGGKNTMLGREAGYYTQTGGGNTYLGYRAGGADGSGNVSIGWKAGFNETGSNKLYIDNSDTSSPLIWGDFSSEIVAINGQLGVGTQSPGYPMELERTGTNASIIVDRTDGAMNYINATSSFANFGSVRNHPLRLVVNSLWTMRLDSNGSLTMRNGATCTAGGEWQNASSRELKENIRDLTTEEAAEALEGLAPVRFNYKADQEDESVGFIAEDVPDLVATKDRKGMSAMDVVAVLTKVMQEQQERDREQQKIIEELRKRIAKLENR